MKKNSAILGAAFLMATSAIGPGFLTQTSLFTSQLLASFGCIILISILLDIGAQLNIWRIITMSEKRAQDLANDVVPGFGYVLATLIGIGGLVFNIGNIAGAGLGLQVLTGIPPEVGAVISCAIAIGIFSYKDAGSLMDLFVKVLGILMILMTVYVAIVSRPPIGEALLRTVWPDKIDFLMIITVVGGTVGGYISFAGAHRLVDAGIKGRQHLADVSRSAVRGILITSLMRYVLFLAALGVVWGGVTLASSNPAATIFQSVGGVAGNLLFGIVLWSAAITSVIGASFTSISFWKSFSPRIVKNECTIISVFIVISTGIFLAVGNPVILLVLAGAVNGLILPLALSIILVASFRKELLHDYHHPVWMQAAGWIVVMVMSYMGYHAVVQGWEKLNF